MYGTHKLDAGNIAVCIKIKVLYLTQQESWKKPFIYHAKYVGRLASKQNRFSFIIGGIISAVLAELVDVFS